MRPQKKLQLTYGLSLGTQMGAATPAIDSALTNTNAFVGDGATVLHYSSTQPAAWYDSNTDRTYQVWEAWDGIKPVVKIKYRFHDTGNAVAPLKEGPAAATSGHYFVTDQGVPVGNLVAGSIDNHGVPAIARDDDGYLYIASGAHAATMHLTRSTNPDDITAWTAQTDLPGGQYTYPHWAKVGSKLLLFLRGNATTDLSYLSLLVGTPSAGTITWASRKDLVDYHVGGTSERFYFGNIEVDGTKVYIPSAWSDNGDTTRRDVYGYIYDNADGSLSNISGSLVTAAASLPINLTTAKASYRIIDMESAGEEGTTPTMRLDTANGRVHLFYTRGLANVGPFANYHTYWDGASFTSTKMCNLPSDPGMQHCATAAVLNSDGSLTAQVTMDGGQGATRGGSQGRMNWTVGGGWTTPILRMSQGTGRPALNGPVVPKNAHPAMQFIWTEESPTLVTTGSFIGRCRGFADGVASPLIVSRYGPEATDIIARMPTAPAANVCLLMKRCIEQLQDDSNRPWAKARQIYVPFAHTAAAALIGWKTSRYPLNAVGSPTFSAYDGYKAGPTSGDYFNTGIANNTLTNTAAAIGVIVNVTVDGISLVGAGTTANLMSLSARQDTNSYGANWCASAGSAGASSQTVPNSLLVSLRRNGTTQEVRVNGVIKASGTATNISTNSESILFGRRTTTPSNAKFMAMYVAANDFDENTDLAFYNAFNPFINAITPGALL